MKNILKKLLKLIGYKLEKLPTAKQLQQLRENPYTSVQLKSEQVVDLDALEMIAYNIPGMISPISGSHLYTLCYFQNEEGDIVEIGSWQGRSMSFLARAAQNSDNGKCYAVDHFKGNIGKEHYYIIEKTDLSDLKSGFINNIEKVGLSKYVTLLNMTNEEAANKIRDNSVRFLFVDGDHTRKGVEKDIQLFFPKLINGAIVVFDDCSGAFPGVVEAVDALLTKGNHSRVMSYQNTIVIKYQIN